MRYQNVYDADDIVKDGEVVRVPNYMMDAAPGRVDNRSAAVKARDDAHRLMCDRMTRPKDFDPITGKRLDDGIADDLSEEDLVALAKRLGPVMGVGVPDNYLAGVSNKPGLSSSRPATEAAPPSRGDSRRPHAKQARDHATGNALRDRAYAEYLARLTGGRR